MIWDFLLYSLPWWAQVALLAIPVVVAFWFAVGIFGWERVRPFFLPVLAIIGAGAMLSRARQQGWQDKVEKDRKAAEKIISKADKARTEADKKNADPKKLRDDDGYRRD